MVERFEVDLNDVDDRGYVKVRGLGGVEVGAFVRIVDPDDGTELVGRIAESLPDLDLGFVVAHGPVPELTPTWDQTISVVGGVVQAALLQGEPGIEIPKEPVLS